MEVIMNETASSAPEQRVEISLTVMNQVMAYLGSRPYQDVAQLIANISASVRIVAVAEEPGDTEAAGN
jgi:hypothetical protein